MTDLPSFLPILQTLNVLIVPALVFVVRIDRRMGQIDVVTAASERRIDALEKEVRQLIENLVRIEYSTRHT